MDTSALATLLVDILLTTPVDEISVKAQEVRQRIASNYKVLKGKSLGFSEAGRLASEIEIKNLLDEFFKDLLEQNKKMAERADTFSSELARQTVDLTDPNNVNLESLLHWKDMAEYHQARALNDYQMANLEWLLSSIKKNLPQLDTGDWFMEILSMCKEKRNQAVRANQDDNYIREWILKGLIHV